jgi:NAD(P)-dependent dehydrogenase (short-subunit alcohol dehydrogenase family)
MNMDRRSVSWSTLLAGAAGVAFAIARQKKNASAVRELRGKVVLITGGSRGLGFAIAEELAPLGARLVLTSRHGEELERAKTRLLASGCAAAEDVLVQVSDVSVPEEIQEVVNAATAHFGRIDVIINNAGIILVGPVESQPLASFQEAMNINFYGALHTTLAVLPQMLERGDGAIVNIASIGGKVAFPHLLPYVASKFAMTGWSQGLRAELAGKGIRVTTVSPGVMRTGSHIQARYTGNAEEEYRWFGSAASLPVTATSASLAARKVVKALALGTAEISIGLQAIAAARASNLAPEFTAKMLSVANGLLPNPGGMNHSVLGKALRGSLPDVIERAGTEAIERYNQEETQEMPVEHEPR